MTAAASLPRHVANPLEVFAARAEVRAYLWAEGEISDLIEAVDKLQADAVRDGLIAAIGQDGVQAMIGRSFAAVRQPCIAVEPAPDVVPDPIPEPAPGKHAANSTVDALVYSLRQRGCVALAERDTRRRIAALSTRQIREVIARLMRLRARGHYPAITDELICQLGEQL
jgi:hypothetical protein